MRVTMTGITSLVLFAQPTIAQQLSKETPSDPAFARATAAVNAKLKDPQSARYGEMIRKVGANVNGKPEEVVCGKNSFGEYGGNRRFVYFIADGGTYLVEENPQPEDVAQIIYGRFCK
jgi:hypothetical protein